MELALIKRLDYGPNTEYLAHESLNAEGVIRLIIKKSDKIFKCSGSYFGPCSKYSRA